MVLAVKRDKKVGLAYMKSYEIEWMMKEEGRKEGRKEADETMKRLLQEKDLIMQQALLKKDHILQEKDARIAELEKRLTEMEKAANLS